MKPYELSFSLYLSLPISLTNTHKPTYQSVSMYDVVTAQPGTVPTTSSGSLENNRGVKMSDRHLTTHAAATDKGEKCCNTHTDTDTDTHSCT